MRKQKVALPVTRKKAQAVAIIDRLNRELKTAKTAKAKLAVRDKARKYAMLYSLLGMRSDELFELNAMYCRAEFDFSKIVAPWGQSVEGLSRQNKSKMVGAYKSFFDCKVGIEDALKVCKAKDKQPTRDFFRTLGKPFGTGRFEWYTPPWVYERCRHIMGSIDLDPASSRKAVKMGNKAGRIFTKKDNALKKDWGKCGNVFINPPYTLSGPEVTPLDKPDKKVEGKDSGCMAFLTKLLQSDYKQAIMLVLEDSGTSYGQTLWSLANAVFIPDGRLHFIYEGKDKGKNTTRSSVLFGLSVNPLKWWLAFNRWGRVILPYKTPSQRRFELEKRSGELTDWVAELYKLPHSESRIKKKQKVLNQLAKSP